MFNFKFLILAIWLIIVLPAFAGPPEIPADLNLNDYSRANSVMNDITRYWQDEEELAGIAVAIFDDKKVIWKKNLGKADTNKNINISDGTKFRVGAVTTVLTSALVLKLQELGLLNINDDIRDYIPEFDIKYHDNKQHKITIKNLLTHHAGLPISILKDSWVERAIPVKSILPKLKRTYAANPPDLVYGYSNLGYSLIGIAIENITKKPFNQIMRQYLLDPIQLHNTFMLDEKADKAQLAVGYKEEKMRSGLIPRDVASLGLVSNMGDLVTFFQNMMSRNSGRILKNDSVNKYFSSHNNSILLDVDKRVGFGWNVGGLNVKNAGKIVWRTGSTLGFRSRVAILPDKKLGIIVLSNDAGAWKAAEGIVESGLQIYLNIREELSDQNKINRPLNEKRFHVDKFLTSYNSMLGYIPIKDEIDYFQANVLGWDVQLVRDTSPWYKIEYSLFGLLPINISWIADTAVRPVKIATHDGVIAKYKNRQYLFAVNKSLNEPDHDWKSRLGEYRIINSDKLLEEMEISTGELVLKNNYLFFKYEFPNFLGFKVDIPLNPISKDVAIIPGLGTGLNESIQVVYQGSKQYLEYSGYLLEKLEKKDSVFNFDF